MITKEEMKEIATMVVDMMNTPTESDQVKEEKVEPIGFIVTVTDPWLHNVSDPKHVYSSQITGWGPVDTDAQIDINYPAKYDILHEILMLHGVDLSQIKVNGKIYKGEEIRNVWQFPMPIEDFMYWRSELFGATKRTFDVVTSAIESYRDSHEKEVNEFLHS